MSTNSSEAPRIDQRLLEQVLAVRPSTRHGLEYRPCRVSLSDGNELDRVYVVPADEYIAVWGVWPWDDPAKRYVHLADVEEIRESPSRLPAQLANKLYEAGETGMGYCVFQVVMSDGRRLDALTGNAVDFLALPPGESVSDVVDVLPHEGKGREHAGVKAADYAWCVYRL